MQEGKPELVQRAILTRDIIDTIGLSLEGFEAITGEKPKGEEEYIELDSNFWAGCRMLAKAHKAGKLAFAAE